MASPNQRAYVAHKKYAMIADLLGLGDNTIEERIQRLVGATEQLLDRLNVP
jgi:alcohol dehydrogenase class IV